MEATELIKKISSLKNDIRDYIVNTEHWLFYWINNKEVQEFVKRYPKDYEDYINLSVISLNSSPTFEITFYDHPDGIESIQRFAVLSTFRDYVKARWAEWNGKVKELQIAEKEEELEYYKKRVSDAEKEIKELKML